MKFLLAAVLLLLTACAPLRDPWGLAVSRGLPGEALPPPDSLQADVGITPRASGLIPFSTRLYAKPNHAYRIDAFGFPPLIAASYLWTEGRWMWIRHDKKQVGEGTGNQLELEDSPLRLPDVHAVLGFLWGRALPGFLERDTLLAPGPAGEIRWIHQGETWEAHMDAATGLCREVRSAGLSIKYGLHERRGGRVIPGEAEIFADGVSIMVLRLRDLNESPKWRKNPFVLVPPPGYERP
jgi:hypothetical protein